MKNFYVTTPIYYPSNNLHMGNAYTTILADSLARYKKSQGFDTYFLTGTDEHGQKLQRKAEEMGKTPKDFIDGMVVGIKELWETLNIQYDGFIRTTDEHHKKCVQEIFTKLHKKGDIYKSTYEGWYCTPCETFLTDTQLVADPTSQEDNRRLCPDCSRAVEKTSEESYFFKMSKYAPALLKYIEENPSFVQPETRRNEVISFINQGVDDLCVSRTTFDWGIKVPFDDKHVVYVWLDALTNYYNHLNPELLDKFWGKNADVVHLVGKDILRFHAIIWPCVLMALDVPLPTTVFAHGWLMLDGGAKMSKSKAGSADPLIYSSRYGVDSVRYYALRELPYGDDGKFSAEQFLNRLNLDLANDLGNLVSRTTAMTEKYFSGTVSCSHPSRKCDSCTPSHAKADKSCNPEQDRPLFTLIADTTTKTHALMDEYKFAAALKEIWELISHCNKYIELTTPWTLAKDEANLPRLERVMYNLLEGIRTVATLIAPVMPETSEKIAVHIGWNGTDSYSTHKGESLFPRVDIAKELEELEQI